MSIRAYLITETDEKIIDCKKYVYEKEELFFNVWHESRVFDIIAHYGFDGTNDDCVGELEIHWEEWDGFKENYKENVAEGHDYGFSKNEKEVLQRIDALFKEGHEFLRFKLW